MTPCAWGRQVQTPEGERGLGREPGLRDTRWLQAGAGVRGGEGTAVVESVASDLSPSLSHQETLRAGFLLLFMLTAPVAH